MGTSSTMAIDNIAFHNCSLPSATARNCAANQWKCPKTNICVSRYVFCDSVDDCGHRFDETSDKCKQNLVIRCIFEDSEPCNWKLEYDKGSKSWWQTITAITANTNKNMVRMTGPLTDHTYKNGRV